MDTKCLPQTNAENISDPLNITNIMQLITNTVLQTTPEPAQPKIFYARRNTENCDLAHAETRCRPTTGPPWSYN